MERAGRLIGKVKLPKDATDPETRARAAWDMAAGKKIAEHSRVRSLVRGTLVVEVEDMVWQRQLNTLRYFLLRNLAGVLGEPLVTEIDFRPMASSKLPRFQPGRADAASPTLPRRAMAAAASASGIQDPVLDALYRQSKNRNSA